MINDYLTNEITPDELYAIRNAADCMKRTIMSERMDLEREASALIDKMINGSASGEDIRRQSWIIGKLNAIASACDSIDEVVDEIGKANAARFEAEYIPGFDLSPAIDEYKFADEDGKQ